MQCIRGVDGTRTECPALEKIKTLRINYPDNNRNIEEKSIN